MSADADKGFRYTAEQNKWLNDKVNEAVAAGVTGLSEMGRLLHDDWMRHVGRKSTFDAFLGKLKKCAHFRAKRSGSGDGGVRVRRQFAEDSVIFVISKNGLASVHKDLDAALSVVNGAVADYTFYEGRPFRVAYETVLVVK